jgi:N-acetylated-alpha-linked acidic dipeptidase
VTILPMRLAIAAVTILAIATALALRDRASLFGFSPATAAAQLALERHFIAQTDTSRLRDTHRLLTSQPHPAGSPRDRELAGWIAQQFRSAGMEGVELTTHEVLLPEAREVAIEMTHPRSWHASMREPAVGKDDDTAIDPSAIGIPFHAYSASGTVEAPIVYAGDGQPADYDWLASHGVDVRGKIAIVRHTTPYSYRGYKALTAQHRGAAGLLIFSDPAFDGSARGTPYPDGPWGPDSRIERGGILFDFLVPGDPLTPGWASVAGAKRIAREAAVSLPAIVSAPLSAMDAREILASLGGAVAPAAWHGALSVPYRVGPGPARVRLRVQADMAITPIWTVTGLFRGTESPDDVVIVGNHRDAWVYGGVDPSSGTAALVELARTLGVTAKSGWRPKRSLLFASWDGEELALASSTEWGEQHAARLRDRAVAYLNVDSAASGSRFVAAAVPSLSRLLADVAQAVRDPSTGTPVAAVARERRNRERGIADENVADFIDARIGGGSDYTVFLNHLGVPVADISFDGPHGVYHSLYDTHRWVNEFGDPQFRYHAALVQLWGVAALRLTNADVLPIDPAASASRIREFVREIEPRLLSFPVRDRPSAQRQLDAVKSALETLSTAATSFDTVRSRAIEHGDRALQRRLNESLIGFERAFLDDRGLPGRPWYRHLVHAPKFNYHPEILPGIAASLEAGDEATLEAEIARFAAALQRATRVLSEIDPALR